MEVNLLGALGLFFLAGVAIVAAGIYLTASADIIATRMGLGRLWVGSLLLAGATSLPELVTAVAAAVGGSAALAAGDVLGANMLNMSNLAILLAIFGGHQVFSRLASQQVLVSGSAILLTGLVVIFVALKPEVEILAISVPAIVLIATYVGLSWVLRKFVGEEEANSDEEDHSHSLRWGWTVFIITAVVIFGSGPLLAYSAQRVADITGVASSFVGVLGLALVTTLPELTTTFAALRMSHIDMAVANMYGTNSFNIMALAVADLFYTRGVIFSDLDASHVGAGLFAILLMSIGTLQLVLRRPMRRFSLTEPSPLLFVGLYLVGLAVVFQLG